MVTARTAAPQGLAARATYLRLVEVEQTRRDKSVFHWLLIALENLRLFSTSEGYEQERAASCSCDSLVMVCFELEVGMWSIGASAEASKEAEGAWQRVLLPPGHPSPLPSLTQLGTSLPPGLV